MAADAEGPPRTHDTPPRGAKDAAGARSDAVAPSEDYGPLRVERHRKDDGRSLILYSWRGEAEG